MKTVSQKTINNFKAGLPTFEFDFNTYRKNRRHNAQFSRLKRYLEDTGQGFKILETDFSKYIIKNDAIILCDSRMNSHIRTFVLK